MTPNPFINQYPIATGESTGVHIRQPEFFYQDGRPLPRWLNPPLLLVPVPLEVYALLPFPESENIPGTKINADGKMHVVFYAE